MIKRLHKPILVIIFLWLIFSSPYWVKGLMPFPSKYLVTFFPPWNQFYGMPVKNSAMPDVITQIYPWKKITIDSWKRGQIPRWNPYQFSGNAHLANFQTAVFSPINLLFFILPFNDAWSVMILLQPLLAGIFMYLYLRSIERSAGASLFGSISFMFCSFIVTWMAYGTLAYAILFLPLLLYGVERYLRDHHWHALVIITISIPLSIFSGHFQTSIYFLFASFSYVVFKGIVSRRLRQIVVIMGCMGLGLVISLPQLIPTYHLYQQSVRSNLFNKGEVIPWQYVITAFAPDFFGNPVTRNDWFGHFAEWGSFSGTIPFIMALFTVVSKQKQKLIWYFRLLFLFAFLLAFPTPFGDWLVAFKVPVLSTSAFSRIIVLLSFAMSVLASFGLDAVIDNWNKSSTKKFTYRWLMICGGLVVVSWIFVFLHNLFFLPNIDVVKVLIARNNLVLPSILLFLTCVIWFMGYQHRFGKKIYILITTIILLSAFDSYRFASKWMPFDPKEYMYPKLEVLTYLQEHVGYSRVFGNFGNEAQSVFGLYGTEGYDPLFVNRYGELITSLKNGIMTNPSRSVVNFDKNGINSKTVLDLLGVRYLLHSKGDQHNIWVFPFWQYVDSFGMPVYSDDKFEIYQNNGAFPRAFLVDEYKVIEDRQGIIDYLYDEETDLRKTIVLEKQPSVAIDPCQKRDSQKLAEIQSYTPNEVVMKTTTQCPALLFLSDSYYPGWSVVVNGQRQEIYRADYAFRAVIVPAGESLVKFSYEDWRY